MNIYINKKTYPESYTQNAPPLLRKLRKLRNRPLATLLPHNTPYLAALHTRRLRARPAFGDRRQGQQATALLGVLEPRATARKSLAL